MALGSISYAQTRISSHEALEACQSFIANNSTQKDCRSLKIDSAIVSQNNDTLLYFVSENDSLYYVIPGTKSMPMILAIINKNNDGSISSNDNYWIEYYKKSAINSISEKVGDIYPDWNSAKTKHRATETIIGPLLSTAWGQDYSNTGSDRQAYNYYVTDFCDDCGCYAPVGCIAVAMGQIMNYWKYPIMQYNKSSDHFYDWCNMTDSLNTCSSNYQLEKMAIARLLYDCGIAANMRYCVHNGESFAWPHSAKSAFVNEFGYSNSIDIIRRQYFSNESWKERLIEEIAENRPILYAAMLDTNDDLIPMNGHAFVCDGYDRNSDLFHFNWGHTGTNTGWYCIDDLNIGRYDLSYQRAIVKISPSEESFANFCNTTLELNDYFHEYYNINRNDSPEPFNNIPYVAGELISTHTQNSTSTDWNTIPIGETSSYFAHHSVALKPGFRAERGSDFNAKIIPCSSCPNTENIQNAPNLFCNPIIGENQHLSLDTPFSDNKPNISKSTFPNPAHETVSITSNDIDQVYLYDINGKPVFRWYISSKGDNLITLDIKDIPTGMYIIRATKKDNSVEVYRFVKN